MFWRLNAARSQPFDAFGKFFSQLFGGDALILFESAQLHAGDFCFNAAGLGFCAQFKFFLCGVAACVAFLFPGSRACFAPCAGPVFACAVFLGACARHTETPRFDGW